jgi:hypothetical protein
MEYDNLLYVDLQKIYNILKTIPDYSRGAGIVDNHYQCIPSFMYFKDSEVLKDLVSFILSIVLDNDMSYLGSYIHSGKIGCLPTLTKKYAEKLNLLDKQYLYKNANKFNMVFDARCVGQYIGGVDPRNIPGDTRGFINTDCIFNVSQINVKIPEKWKCTNTKETGIKDRPEVCDVPICNLHIHSKNLKEYLL